MSGDQENNEKSIGNNENQWGHNENQQENNEIAIGKP